MGQFGILTKTYRSEKRGGANKCFMVRSNSLMLLSYIIFIMHLNFERAVLKCNILITYLT